jgi:formylglycine-generating enzyme required for sulfatase activity
MEKLHVKESGDASIIRGGGISELLKAKGKYLVQCFDKNGKLKWKDTINNVVTDVGANQLLDSAFGSGPVAGPFLGLISSVGYTGIPVAADTMASHASGGHVWNEAGNGSNYPNWSTPTSNARATITFAGATGRAKALSSVASFVIATNGGTVKGCFIVFGTGAVATNNDTNGKLYSAGVFSGGDKVVATGDTLQVSYSTSV